MRCVVIVALLYFKTVRLWGMLPHRPVTAGCTAPHNEEGASQITFSMSCRAKQMCRVMDGHKDNRRLLPDMTQQ